MLSSPAIEDLKLCLHKTNQQPSLVTSLVESMKAAFLARLLRAGTTTILILEMCANLIAMQRFFVFFSLFFFILFFSLFY